MKRYARAQRNPALPANLRIMGDATYPPQYKLYGGYGMTMLNALVAADVRIPLFLFMTMQSQFEKDRGLKLFLETGTGFDVLFIERVKLTSHKYIGRVASAARLTKAQLDAFRDAGMKKFNPYRVQIDL